MKDARPGSIRWFERLFYIGLPLAALNALLIGTHVDGHAVLSQWSLGFVMFMVVSIGLNLLLLWLIAYRESNAARWVFVCLVLLGILSDVADIRHIRDYGDLSFALTLNQNLLCAIEILLLFRRDSRDWFAGRRPVDPEIFR